MDIIENYDPLADRPPDQEERIEATVDLLKIWRWYKKRRDKVDDAGVYVSEENRTE